MTKTNAPYKCAFSISNEILYKSVELGVDIGKISVSELRYGIEDAAEATKYSLLTEGIALTPSQYRGLLDKEEIPSEPIANALFKTYCKLPHLDAYDPESLVQTFEANLFREGVPNRLSRKVKGFDYPLPAHNKIEALIKGLYSFANNGKRKVHPLTLSCLFYFEILAIQPYSEYSKMFALLVAKAILGDYNKLLFALPLERLMLKNEKMLDAAYEESVDKGDIGPFILAMLSIIQEGVDTLSRRSVRKPKLSSDQVKRLLSVMSKGRYYGALELCSLLGLKSRLGLSKNYLSPALEAGLIERSNPLSPTSRSQKYRLKEGR